MAHQHRRRLPARPPGPARLLPHLGNGAGEPVHHDGIEAPDVDAELQGGRCGHAEELTRGQRPLDLPPLARQVPRPVGPDAVGGPGIGHDGPGVLGDQLGGLAGLGEGDRADALPGEGGEEAGRLPIGRGPGRSGTGGLVPGAVLEGGVPEGEQALAPRAAVPAHLDEGNADEALGKVARVADGGGGEDEPRVRSVVAGDPPEPPQDAADVAPEHPPQRVGLVDHDVGEVGEQLRPAGVGIEHPVVHHVRVGQDDAGVAAHETALGGRRVAVVGGGAHLGEGKGPDGPELVLGEGLGGVEVERPGLAVGEQRLEDREVEAEALAAGRAGRDHHVAAVPDGCQRLGLVCPQAGDAQGRHP